MISRGLLFVLLLAVVSVQAEVRISAASDEGADCFKIETATATYYYQKGAGGFSSIVDREGRDWLGYHRSDKEHYPASAASDYRGLPNLVYGSSDRGAGHPGFDRCVSIQIDESSIRSFSKSGQWQWLWSFTDEAATLTVEAADPEHAYWFLYEGPIAGQFDPLKQYWGNSREGPITSFPDYVKEGPEFDQWDWAYFGQQGMSLILLIEHLTPDRLPDCMGYMGNSKAGLNAPDGMVVFGFGRYKRASPLMTALPNRFRIRLIDTEIDSTEAHETLATQLKL